MNGLLQARKKRTSTRSELFLKPLCAIAAITRPSLASVDVAAFAAIMCILYLGQFEELFPIGPFFLEGGGTITNLYPSCLSSGQLPRYLHVPEVLTFGDGPFAESTALDGFK